MPKANIEEFEAVRLRRFGYDFWFLFCSCQLSVDSEGKVPAWSTEIANELISAGSRNGQAFDQIQLQKLVYIAHGWCLAMSGQPLTGDRPEAWDMGPMYRRLAGALSTLGRKPVVDMIDIRLPLGPPSNAGQIRTEMEELELQVIGRVSRQYGCLSPSQLSVLTSGDDGPWASIYDSGTGRFREISHALIRDQFVQFAQRIGDCHDHN